jgi:hypothetical protein
MIRNRLARALSIGVELPCDFRLVELKRRDMYDVAPNQDRLASARDAKTRVADFMARRGQSLDIGV